MKRFQLSRILDELWRLLLIIIGAVLAGVGFALFQVPYNIAAGGVSEPVSRAAAWAALKAV